MRSAPEGVPAATSSAWHSRRWWDSLGYLRVRSLGNPRWRRDVPWLVRWLQREAPPAEDPLRPQYDRAIAAAHRYQRLRDRKDADLDAAWDDVLAPIDAILQHRQRAHLDAVRGAGVSGDHVSPPAREVDTP